MRTKAQVSPIVPVAALVVATLAAGAAMWQELFVARATSAVPPNAARGAADATARDAPLGSTQHEPAHHATHVATPAPK